MEERKAFKDIKEFYALIQGLKSLQIPYWYKKEDNGTHCVGIKAPEGWGIYGWGKSYEDAVNDLIGGLRSVAESVLFDGGESNAEQIIYAIKIIISSWDEIKSCLKKESYGDF